MTDLTKFQDTAQRKCLQWLWDRCCDTTELEDKPFLIVSGWDVVATKSFEHIAKTAMGSDWDDYDQGFNDEYSTCNNCNTGIRFSPDSYGWQPDFWFSEDGYACKKCVKEHLADYYLEDRRDHSDGVRAINSDLLDPKDTGYIIIIQGCEHGLHEHQNDDPRTIADWAEENDLWVLFTISTGQFDVEWDAYMRHSEDRELVETEIKEIRDALIETSHKSSYGNRDYLKPEFKQWPTPADLCKSQLKQVSEMGAKFASVGGENGLVTYENIKAMQEALKD